MIARRLLVCGLLTATFSVLVCAGHHSIVVYAVRFGGGSKDLPAALAVDATGHAFVVGSTYSEDFPATTSHRKAQNLSWAAFVTKLAPDASSLVYSTIISGHGMTFSTAAALRPDGQIWVAGSRSEEHTSELQSRLHLVCRLLLEKKKTNGDITVLLKVA